MMKKKYKKGNNKNANWSNKYLLSISLEKASRLDLKALPFQLAYHSCAEPYQTLILPNV